MKMVFWVEELKRNLKVAYKISDVYSRSVHKTSSILTQWRGKVVPGCLQRF